MIVGKWNKSVILTYVGMAISILGIFLSLRAEGGVLLSMSCLIVAGICDLFDGFIARKCKRTEEEKAFGIQLDSLVDVISFIALPIAIFLGMGLQKWYHLPVYLVFAICGIARLGYFNIQAEGKEEPVSYYTGLPVTYSALIFPVCYLLRYVLPEQAFFTAYPILMLLVAGCNVFKWRVRKPRGLAYGFFSLLAVGMLILYLAVLS